MAPTYKLHYFNAMGHAEGSRLILAHAGIKYEDHRIGTEEWEEMKPKMPFGKLPVLEVDGVLIAESRAIQRYLAREYGLTGKDCLESALCDMVVDAVRDMTVSIFGIVMEKDPTMKEEMKQKYVKETLPPNAECLEKLLIKNGTGYIVGNDVTWADIVLASVTSSFDVRMTDCIKNYPNLKAHYEKIMDLPNIKKWVDERPITAH